MNARTPPNDRAIGHQGTRAVLLSDGSRVTPALSSRRDYHYGSILPYVLRQLLGAK